MIEPTQLDLQRAREITNLYGGNGLSTTQSERLVAEKLAEWRSAPLQDAERWRYYASSPQTAAMLGSKLDPGDDTIDWVAECNRLCDEWRSTPRY